MDAGWAADKKRQLSESQGATDRETRSPGGRRRWAGTPPGVPTSRVEALRLSPPPAGNPHREARGQAWTGAASLRPPWDRAEPGPGPSLEAAAQTPPGCWDRGRRDRQTETSSRRETDPRSDSGADQRDTQRDRATLSTKCTLGAAPETRAGVGGRAGPGAGPAPIGRGCLQWEPVIDSLGGRDHFHAEN